MALLRLSGASLPATSEGMKVFHEVTDHLLPTPSFTRKSVAASVLAVLVVAAASVACAQPAPAGPVPKVLVVAIDGLRPDALAAANTPTLDALIAGKPVPKFADAQPKQPQKRAQPDSMIGKTAPAFAIKTLDGKDVSNAGLATPNEGMDTLGIRYGYRF